MELEVNRLSEVWLIFSSSCNRNLRAPPPMIHCLYLRGIWRSLCLNIMMNARPSLPVVHLDNCYGGRRGRGELLARRRRRLDLDSDDWAESSAARRRHSRVSRRWTARQAEMIDMIERRNWESELIALVGLHTVSMLDASFLRESKSPTLRHQGNVERPSTHASSFLQMWQELEDEHALHHARQRLRQRRNVESTANASIHALKSGGGENQSRFGEASGSDNDYAIWSHDHQLGPQTMRDHDNSSHEQSPDLGEVERETERQIVHG